MFIMNWNWYRFRQTLEAIGALFIVIGLLTLAAGLREYRASLAAADWPAADGTIIISGTAQVQQRGRMLVYIDAARLVYDYTVDGATYENDRIDLGDKPVKADSKEGRALLEQFPVGERVPVYYNPAAPADSVLLRDLQVGALRAGGWMLGLGLAVLALRWILRQWPNEGNIRT